MYSAAAAAKASSLHWESVKLGEQSFRNLLGCKTPSEPLNLEAWSTVIMELTAPKVPESDRLRIRFELLHLLVSTFECLCGGKFTE